MNYIYAYLITIKKGINALTENKKCANFSSEPSIIYGFAFE